MNLRMFLPLILLMSNATGTQGQRPLPAREQTIFSEVHPIQHAAPLPDAVLKLPLQRPEVKRNLEAVGVPEGQDLMQMFTAAEIHLGAARKADLIVAGNTPMSGADNSWFWIVHSPHKNPRIVLFAGAYSLELTAGKTNGFRDVRTEWSSPQETVTRTYSFDGKTYRLRKESRTRVTTNGSSDPDCCTSH